MLEIFQYDFFLNAFLAALLASFACGIVGTFVVVRKVVFISGGIAHTAYGGIGLGYLMGINPLIGAFAFSTGAAYFISAMRRKNSSNEDTLIGILWAVGMALGIVFISLTPGYTPNLMSYLFGDILTVPFDDILIMIAADIIIAAVVFFNLDKFIAITFDEEYSRTLGLPVDRLYFLLYVLIALTTVILIKLVGIILVIALLTIPPTISIKFTKSIKSMMLLSILLGILFSFLGLLLSYYLNLASGASIILVGAAGFIFSVILTGNKN